MLPLVETDDALLDVVEGTVLGTRFIEEFLLTLAASGVAPEAIAPDIKERERQIAKMRPGTSPAS